MNQLVHQPPVGVPLTTACTALGLNRSSICARRRAGSVSDEERAQHRSRRSAPQPRALSEAERQALREILYSPTYRDQPSARRLGSTAPRASEDPTTPAIPPASVGAADPGL